MNCIIGLNKFKTFTAPELFNCSLQSFPYFLIIERRTIVNEFLNCRHNNNDDDDYDDDDRKKLCINSNILKTVQVKNEKDFIHVRNSCFLESKSVPFLKSFLA